jgi:ectoine hydroxylase-related dioxygenase (phytanoyl-CoA dioxygenase family)
VRAEGGLGLHLDQNPFDPYANVNLFRPIQGFVALTDHFSSEAGGIKVVKKFHTEIDTYFEKSHDETKSSGGGFYRMNSKVHAKLAKRCEPLFMPKGSLCLWDNKLPHQTSDTLTGTDTREVVYCSFLPSVEMNNVYIEKQLQSLQRNVPPPAFFDASNKSETADRNWNESELTTMQKQFLGME